jgi:hypothetical protein
MNKVHSTVFNKEADQTFNHVISLSKSGLYVIEITAAAKSWWQNTTSRRSFLKKDSLTVRLDGRDITPIQRKRKLRANDLWNGNLLNGSEQTVYALASLVSGSHNLSFIVHGKPFLSLAALFFIDDGTVTLRNLTPKKKNRTPWLTFLFGDLIVLKSLKIEARTSKQTRDDDDMALHIDGLVVMNEDPKSHRPWYWCGRTLHGLTKKFVRDFDENSAPARIDFFADGTPILDTISLAFLQKSQNPIGVIALYSDIEETQRYVRCVLERKRQTAGKVVALVLTLFVILPLCVSAVRYADQNDFFEPAVSEYEALTARIASFPTAVVAERDNQLVFFDSRKKEVKHIPISRLNLEKPSADSLLPDDDILTHIASDVIEYQPRAFIFAVASTWTCGASNCGWTLFRYDAKDDRIDMIAKSILATELQLYSSSKNSQIIISSDTSMGVCNGGAYLDMLDPQSMRVEPITGFEDQTFLATGLKSVQWNSESEIEFSIWYACGSPSGTKDETRVYRYNTMTKALDMLGETAYPFGG